MLTSVLRIVLIYSLIATGLTHLKAQDFSLTDLEWIQQEDTPDLLPKMNKLRIPRLPEGLRGYDGYAYGLIEMSVHSSGQRATFAFRGTHPTLTTNLLSAPSRRGKPAQRGEEKVFSAVWSALIFNPKESSENARNGQPRLLQIAPGRLPHAADKSKTEVYSVSVTVGQNGRITDAVFPDGVSPDMRSEGLTALKKWKFRAARKEGIPVESRVEVPLMFRRSFNPLHDPDQYTPPEVIKRVKARFPKNQWLMSNEAVVVVEFAIDLRGNVGKAHVVQSNNPAYNSFAIEAVEKWKYKPARYQGVPMKARMKVPMTFSLLGSGDPSSLVEHSKDKLANLPEEFRYDVAPKLINIEPAVYPFEAAMNKDQGVVEYSIYIDPTGKVRVAKIYQSPSPSLSQAVTAMVDTMRFEPALKQGHPTHAVLAMKLQFGGAKAEVLHSKSTRSILSSLRNGMKIEDYPILSDLDKPLRAIFRKRPTFPSSIDNTKIKGNAKIEFFVDREGEVQLPRTVSASEEAFGYAACQAIASWKFEPPLKDGRKVVVRVRVPVVFKR